MGVGEILLFPFYADDLTTMAVRIKDGDNLLRPHKKHLYQLLANEMGISHWKVSMGYGLLQLFIGIAVILVKPLGVFAIILLLVAFMGAFAWLNYFVRTRIARNTF